MIALDIPGSPFCRVDWRWRLAGAPVSRSLWLRRRLREHQDDWVLHARHYIAAEHGTRSVPARELPEPMKAAIKEAANLANAQDQALLWRLQAFLLAGEPPEAVASRFGLHPMSALAYERLFFGVTDRLRHGDWVLLQAILDPDDHELRTLGTVWKQIGYYGGPRAAEVTIAVTTDAPLPAWTRRPDDPQPEFSERVLRAKVRLFTMVMTARTYSELAQNIRLREELDEVCGRELDDRTRAMMPLWRQLFEMAAGKRRKDSRHPRSKASSSAPVAVPELTLSSLMR